jgi:hypothetical protein
MCFDANIGLLRVSSLSLPKAPNSRLVHVQRENGCPATTFKFVFPPVRPNSPYGVSRTNPIYRGLAGHRRGEKTSRARPEPKNTKILLLRLATTSHPQCRHRNHPLPRRSIAAGRNQHHHRIQSAATPRHLVAVHPLPPPLLPPSPPCSHLACDLFGYLPRRWTQTTSMDGELVVADATRDAARDDEHLAILISLLVTIAEEDNRSLVALRRAPKEQAKVEDGRLLHDIRRLLHQ